VRLAQAIAQDLSGRSAILDGEIVHPGPDGRPMFYELMRPPRGPFCFYAFDLLWLDGTDLRDRPLFERKKLLRKLLAGTSARTHARWLYLDGICISSEYSSHETVCHRSRNAG
jgi:ATP-dependent DNA ligase